MAIYQLELGQYTLTVDGHVSPEVFLDGIEARGFTCDVDHVIHGYHVVYQGYDILWIGDDARPPPDVPGAISHPVTFAKASDLEPVPKACAPATPPAALVCPWCGTTRMREMTGEEIKARFHLDDDALADHLTLGTHYICACGGVTVL